MNRPSFLEPLALPSPTSPVAQSLADLAQADYNNNLADEWDSISFWDWRIRCLESRLFRFTKKAAWSVRDLAEVEEIDASLKEAHKRIEELQTA
jgi:hypothetical protein